MRNSEFNKPTQVRDFFSKGNYSISSDYFDLYTEIPNISLSDDLEQEYKLEHQKCYDISSSKIPCLFNLYKHKHPTYRKRVLTENLVWDHQNKKLSDVFSSLKFQGSKVLVITMHDEDFEDWHLEVYRLFIERHVTFNCETLEYVFELNVLRDFINGPHNDIDFSEEPRTVGGGVLDPSDD